MSNSESSPSGSRACGTCNVCCTAMYVRILDKPAAQPCVHQTTSGCGIYDKRPEACRAWYCMWIRDNGRVFDESHRPDTLGVFFTASPLDALTGRQAITAHEVRPNASKEPEARRVINHLRRFAPVRIRPAQVDMIALTHDAQPIAANLND